MNKIIECRKESGFVCRFSVLTVPAKPEMFMMNMQVFDVIPQSVEATSDGKPVTVVWCAVFNLKGMPER